MPLTVESGPYQPQRAVTRVLNVALLRIGLGALFFQAGFQKYQSGFMNKPEMLKGMLDTWLTKVPPSFFKDFLTQLVIPHVHVFSFLVTAGEIGVGIALVLGFCTRLTSLIRIFMNANYYLAAAGSNPGAAVTNELFILCEIVFILTAAGRAAGIDYFLHKKWPRAPFW